MIRIHFKDEGQDVLWWDVNAKGVVVRADMQEWVWKGTQVLHPNGDIANPEDIQVGDHLYCRFKKGDLGMFKHPVEKVGRATHVNGMGRPPKKQEVGS